LRRSWGILVRRFLGRVDPNRRGQRLALRRAIDEAVRVRQVGDDAGAVAAVEDLVGAAVVDDRGAR
jgi:hypothetical protein